MNQENILEDNIQRTLNISRDSLQKELWLEVEKNEIVKICIDKKVKEWGTKLDSKNSTTHAWYFKHHLLLEAIL